MGFRSKAQPSEVAPQDYSNRAQWRSRPKLAKVIRIAVFVLPIATAIGTTVVLGRLLYSRQWALPLRLAWMAAMFVVAAVVSKRVAKLTDRLMPLSALCQLNLRFPKEAPSRVKAALRVGNTAQRERVLAEFQTKGLSSDPQTAAEQVLDLISVLNEHDRKTRGHSEKVRALSDVIAQEMGMSEADRNRLRWASMLHDMGKLSVPSEILNKAGKPSNDEWEILKGHPAAGYEKVAPLQSWLGDAINCVWEHHERYDGSGYPGGLIGTETSSFSRIVAVADAFEVMTAARSYKKPMSYEDARAELVRCSGTHFDPAVVRALLSVGRRQTTMATGAMSSWVSHLFSDSGRIGTVVRSVAETAGSAGSATVIAPIVKAVQVVAAPKAEFGTTFAAAISKTAVASTARTAATAAKAAVGAVVTTTTIAVGGSIRIPPVTTKPRVTTPVTSAVASTTIPNNLALVDESRVVPTVAGPAATVPFASVSSASTSSAELVLETPAQTSTAAPNSTSPTPSPTSPVATNTAVMTTPTTSSPEAQSTVPPLPGTTIAPSTRVPVATTLVTTPVTTLVVAAASTTSTVSPSTTTTIQAVVPATAGTVPGGPIQISDVPPDVESVPSTAPTTTTTTTTTTTIQAFVPATVRTVPGVTQPPSSLPPPEVEGPPSSSPTSTTTTSTTTTSTTTTTTTTEPPTTTTTEPPTTTTTTTEPPTTTTTTTTTTAPPQPSGPCSTVWSATYYPSFDLSGPATSGPPVCSLNFDWGLNPPLPGFQRDFSAVFEADLAINTTSYTFTATYDDGIRVFVDNNPTPIFSDWSSGASRTGTFTIDRGQTSARHVRVEYFDNGLLGYLSLDSKPNIPNGMGKPPTTVPNAVPAYTVSVLANPESITASAIPNGGLPADVTVSAITALGTDLIVADNATGLIYQVTPKRAYSVLYNRGRLAQTFSDLITIGGVLYISDANNGTVSQLAGDSLLPVANGLSNPTAMASDDAGNLYVIESGAARVARINVGTGAITKTFGGGASGNSFAIPTSQMQLVGPVSLAARGDGSTGQLAIGQSNGKIWLVDFNVDKAGLMVGTHAGPYAPSPLAWDQAWGSISDLSFLANGTLVATDVGSHAVRFYDTFTGTSVVVAGELLTPGTVSLNNGAATAPTSRFTNIKHMIRVSNALWVVDEYGVWVLSP